jgi:uncharacterized membrane protein YhaH (DUF805 family)
MQPDSPYQSPTTFEPPAYLEPGSNLSLTKRQILFSFKGRIPRRTYWAWTIASTAAFLLPLVALAGLLDSEGTAQVIGFILLVPIIILFAWTSLAIKVKRWHDHDKSWVWLLIGLIPYAGGIISLIFLGCLRGTLGHNRYGDDPT